MAQQAHVRYRDLRGYLALLESAGLLRRVEAEVDLKHELGAICVKSLNIGGPGLLFENIKGYPGWPLVANILSTPAQLAIAFGTEADEWKITETIGARKAERVPPRVVTKGPCQEEIHPDQEADVYEFPTPWWHERDGGQYLGTTAGVITRDPDTGITNMGMYRVMIKDRNTLTLNVKGGQPAGESPRRPRGEPSGATHILQNEARDRATPIAIALGMDPILTFIAAQIVPFDESGNAEYAAAGGIRGEAVELVKCRSHDLLVPAHAEIIVEGEVLPNVRAPEGPHGESQGFYGWNDHAFVVKVRCITHRKQPISYGLICGCREDYPKFIKYSGLQSMLRALGNVKEVYEPDISGGRSRLAIISARVTSRDDVQEIIEAVQRIPTNSTAIYKPRWTIIVNDDCDVRDWQDVMWRVVMSVMPDQDIRIGPRTDPTAHEPLEEFYDSKASSVVIDATMRSRQAAGDGKEGFPPVNKVSPELAAKVEARWKEYRII